MSAPLGIFGGTFDPVHFGHLEAAVEVRNHLGIEDLRMLPAGDPPHRDRVGASAVQRLEMLKLALEDYPELSLDCRELERSGPSWMVETLEDFRAEFDDRPLLLIIGQDAANGLDSWHRWRELTGLAHLVIVSRPGQAEEYSSHLAQALQGRWRDDPQVLFEAPCGLVYAMDITARNVSSTGVREALAAGNSELEAWVPHSVAEYIRREGLYR